jgi:PST family polysaccharide transporter
MVYVGIILQAMGADFYPRLTGVAGDNAQCNQMVNEQTEISLLLALPGVLGTVAFAPWVVRIFYTGQFDITAEILCWQMAGMLLQLISWPMGFILLAKGLGTLFVAADAVAWSVYIGLAWLGLRWFGLPGMGMAYLGLYLFHILMIRAVVRRCSNFQWTSANIRFGIVAVTTAGVAVCSRLLLSEPWGTAVGALLAVLMGVFSLKSLVAILGPERMNRLMRKLHLPFSFGAARQPPREESK